MKYQVYSPDGIEIAPRYYTSRRAALQALDAWIVRYEAQGYYLTSRWDRINILDLKEYCTLETYENH